MFSLDDSVSVIRDKLKELPLVGRDIQNRFAMTGSGMTEHGFIVGSGDGFKVDKYSGHTIICDEAETIYNSIHTWDESGSRRK